MKKFLRLSIVLFSIVSCNKDSDASESFNVIPRQKWYGMENALNI
jgi:hypothetical protein